MHPTTNPTMILTYPIARMAFLLPYRTVITSANLIGTALLCITIASAHQWDLDLIPPHDAGETVEGSGGGPCLNRRAPQTS